MCDTTTYFIYKVGAGWWSVAVWLAHHQTMWRNRRSLAFYSVERANNSMRVVLTRCSSVTYVVSCTFSSCFCLRWCCRCAIYIPILMITVSYNYTYTYIVSSSNYIYIQCITHYSASVECYIFIYSPVRSVIIPPKLLYRIYIQHIRLLYTALLQCWCHHHSSLLLYTACT